MVQVTVPHRARGVLHRSGVAPLVLLCGLGTGVSLAQMSADTSEALQACRSVENERARLACYDGVLAAEDRAGAASAQAAEPVSGSEPAAATRAPERTSESTVATRAAGPRSEPAAATRLPERAAGPVTASPSAPDAATESAGAARPSEAIGERAAASRAAAAQTTEAERPPEITSVDVQGGARGKGESSDRFSVVVTEISKNHLGTTTIFTDDGRVWTQTDRRTPRFPKTPFAAEIESGRLGSYFLSIPNSRQKVRLSVRD